VIFHAPKVKRRHHINAIFLFYFCLAETPRIEIFLSGEDDLVFLLVLKS